METGFYFITGEFSMVSFFSDWKGTTNKHRCFNGCECDVKNQWIHTRESMKSQCINAYIAWVEYLTLTGFFRTENLAKIECMCGFVTAFFDKQTINMQIKAWILRVCS